MHLFSPEHLAASSGIVGASGPTAAGFALAAQHLRPGTLAAAFFGEGAFNQGMMMEAMNLAAAWKLPVLFVCKDNQWAITTPSSSVTAGNLVERAKSFGMPAKGVNGSDVEAVWETAYEGIQMARKGEGPSFLMARCKHLEGHMLGDPLLRIARRPLKEMKQMGWPLIKSFVKRKGAPIRERKDSMQIITSLIKRTISEKLPKKDDPLVSARKKLGANVMRLKELEEEVHQEIREKVDKALEKRRVEP
jgi:pyruvate dehydrogenase E1 component alpha subunit